MPFLALIIDAAAYFLFTFQKANPSSSILLIGLIIQTVLTLLLIIMLFSYHGKKYAMMQPTFFVRVFSIRYAIMVLSTLLNAFLLFLYALNYFGYNSLFFS